MRILILTFALIIPQFLSAQDWKSFLNSNEINYYDAVKSFDIWNDSIMNSWSQLKNDPSSEEKEEIRLFRRSFKQRSNYVKYRMDASGRFLNDQHLLDLRNDLKERNAFNNITTTGGSWLPVGPNHVLPKYSQFGNGLVGDVTVCEADTAVIYIGTPGGGVWKTTNGGSNWIPVSDEYAALGVNEVKVDPINPDIVYAVFSTTLFMKSVDGGLTWQQLNIPNANYQASVEILIDPINTQTLYLKDYGTLFKSIDAGATWTSLISGRFFDMEFNPLNPETIVAVSNSKLYKSTTAGVLWDSIPHGCPGSDGFSLGLSQSDTNYIYIFSGSGTTNDGFLTTSTDGGITFTNTFHSGNLSSYLGMKNIIVSPSDINQLLFGGIYIARTVDGGTSWNKIIRNYYYQQTSQPFVHVDQREMVRVGNTVWFANDGGVYKTDDFGNSFQDLTGNLQISQVTAFSGSPNDTVSILAGVTHLGALLRNQSGWHCIGYGDGFNTGINPADSDIIFFRDQYGLKRSINGGDSLLPITGITDSQYSFQSDQPIAFNGQNPDAVYYLVNDVWKSNDNGATFFNLSNFPNYSMGGGDLYVHPADSNIMYTTKARSNDGGQTWTKLTPVTCYIESVTVDPQNPARIWALGGDNNNKPLVFYSANSGNSWSTVPTFAIPNNRPIKIVNAQNAYDGLFLVCNNSLWYTDNRLNNWQPFTNGLPYAILTDLYIQPATSKIRLATLGRGIWESGYDNFTNPPLADFVANTDTLCENMPVQFYDNSINCGPGLGTVYQWQFPGGSPSSSTDQHPVVTYASSGNYSVSLKVITPSGIDSVEKVNYISIQNPSNSMLPLQENFESGFPVDWTIQNEDFSYTWSFGTIASGYGIGQNSLYSINKSSTPYVSKDILLTPLISFAGAPDQMLTFDRAYSRYTNEIGDSLKIFFSNDCNLTRTYVYSKGPVDLETAPPVNFAFTPTASQWQTDTISLAGLTTDSQIGFELLNSGGGYIYLDNINISNDITFMEETQNSPVSSLIVQPNPAHESLQIHYLSDDQECKSFEIFELSGRTVVDGIICPKTILNMDINAFSKGFYIIKIVTTSGIEHKTFTIQ